MQLPKAMKDDYQEFLVSMGYTEDTSQRERDAGRTRFVGPDNSAIVVLMDRNMSDMFKAVYVPDDVSEELNSHWKTFIVQKVRQESQQLDAEGEPTGWAIQIKMEQKNQEGEDVWTNETVETGWPIYRTKEQAEQASEIYHWKGQETKVLPVKVTEL